jgi:hypothetical protein
VVEQGLTLLPELLVTIQSLAASHPRAAVAVVVQVVQAVKTAVLVAGAKEPTSLVERLVLVTHLALHHPKEIMVEQELL